MRPLIVLFAALTGAACASPVADQSSTPDPSAAPGPASQCYTVHLGGRPAADAAVPELIELLRDPAPGFVDPAGRFAVREPGASEPRAPLSWWAPQGNDKIELVLGGGYTGYSFELEPDGGGSWVGQGTYFADFGVLPTPPPLPLRLTPRPCP